MEQHGQLGTGTELDLGLAFLTGVLGSGHCVGMCGALVSGFFMQAGQNTKSYLPYFAYHLSRITIYTLIGITAASLGFVLVSSGVMGKVQGALQFIIGTFVIVLAMGILGWIPWQGSFRLLPVSVLRRGFAMAATKGTTIGAAMGGALNGFMPCPLTFAMAVKVTTAPTPLAGGLTMLVFGAGTFPTMIFMSIAFGKLGPKLRGYMLKTAALVMIVMGLNTLYKGFSFYTQESFKHRTFFYAVDQGIANIITWLTELYDYIARLVDILQQ